MKRFSGFPATTRYTPIPDAFFSHLLPGISDIAELKTTLGVFRVLYNKRGYPRFSTHGELVSNASLMNSLEEECKSTEETLKASLQKAVERGTLLHMVVIRDDMPEDIYFLNSDSDRQAVDKIQHGEISLPGLKLEEAPSVAVKERLPDIFTVYEENIGMLTPMISEELREAQKLYPEGWIRDSIGRATKENKRKWSYISAILERWAAEGKSDGTYRRDSKKADPDKYIKGKYGHMVQR